MSVISMKELLEAGVHFGHQTKRWNPKMKRYIFGERNGIYIIDLQKTQKKFKEAYTIVKNTVAEGKVVIFVGTKRQAQETIEEEAKRCGMFYVNNRWLGGTLTNFQTIKRSIEKFKKMEEAKKDGTFDRLPKKEVSKLEKEMVQLEKNLGGIKEMPSLAGVLFVIDPRKERIAVKEARRMGIPIVGIVDTNCDPEEVDFVIPGNDDAIRSIKLLTSKIADAVIEGKQILSAKVEEVKAETVSGAEVTQQGLQEAPMESTLETAEGRRD